MLDALHLTTLVSHHVANLFMCNLRYISNTARALFLPLVLSFLFPLVPPPPSLLPPLGAITHSHPLSLPRARSLSHHEDEATTPKMIRRHEARSALAADNICRPQLPTVALAPRPQEPRLRDDTGVKVAAGSHD